MCCTILIFLIFGDGKVQNDYIKDSFFLFILMGISKSGKKQQSQDQSRTEENRIEQQEN